MVVGGPLTARRRPHGPVTARLWLENQTQRLAVARVASALGVPWLVLRHPLGPHVVIMVPGLVSRWSTLRLNDLDTRPGTMLAPPGPGGCRSTSPRPTTCLAALHEAGALDSVQAPRRRRAPRACINHQVSRTPFIRPLREQSRRSARAGGRMLGMRQARPRSRCCGRSTPLLDAIGAGRMRLRSSGALAVAAAGLGPAPAARPARAASDGRAKRALDEV